MKFGWRFALVALASTLSCGAYGAEALSGCGPIEFAYFNESPPEVVIAVFRQSDLDTKYRLYLCGTQAVHPPAFFLVEEFAKDGERAVDFLEKKLAETSVDATVRD